MTRRSTPATTLTCTTRCARRAARGPAGRPTPATVTGPTGVAGRTARPGEEARGRARRQPSPRSAPPLRPATRRLAGTAARPAARVVATGDTVLANRARPAVTGPGVTVPAATVPAATVPGATGLVVPARAARARAVPTGPAVLGAPGAPGGPGGPAGPGGPSGPGGPGGPGRPGGPAGPGRPGKRKGSWWRHWTWKKALAVTGGLAVLFVVCLFGVYQYIASSTTIPDALASANYQNTTVYYSDGKTVLGTIGTVNRQDLTFSQIPVKLQDSVLAAEDRSFWTEGGISPTGILRAAYDDVTSSGGSLSGGSTLTQQFVKNYYDGVGVQQTASRKIKEIFIAQKLTKTKSKQWILTNYLNLIYLGDNSYGVAAAAQTYFGKPVSQLTTAQDAVIAAIIQEPSTVSAAHVPHRPDRPLALRAQRHGQDERHDPGRGQRDEVPRAADGLLVEPVRQCVVTHDQQQRPVGAVPDDPGLRRAQRVQGRWRRRRLGAAAGHRRAQDGDHDQPPDGRRDVQGGRREHRRGQGDPRRRVPELRPDRGRAAEPGQRRDPGRVPGPGAEHVVADCKHGLRKHRATPASRSGRRSSPTCCRPRSPRA